MLIQTLTQLEPRLDASQRDSYLSRFFYIPFHNFLRQIKAIIKIFRLGRIAAGILHDLMSPLTAIMCSLETLTYNNDQLTEHALESSKTIVSALTLIRAHIYDDTSPQEFSIIEAVQNVTWMLNYKVVRHNVKFIISHTGPQHVFLSKMHTYRVLMNLVSNAVESHHSCSKNNEQNTVTISTSIDNNVLSIVIRDTGCGMTRREQRKMFRQFYSQKEDGLGVGLSVVKTLIHKELGGSIQCTSSKGAGTEFRIEIPLM